MVGVSEPTNAIASVRGYPKTLVMVFLTLDEAREIIEEWR
ncbi:MAG: hypothetical protein NVSMB64_29030 [Candidatus Velthaea sp.]